MGGCDGTGSGPFQDRQDGRTLDAATGRRFRPLAQETREGRHPSTCRRGDQTGPCCTAASSRPGAPACERGRTSRIIGLAARLGDGCTTQPPPLSVPPPEDGP